MGTQRVGKTSFYTISAKALYCGRRTTKHAEARNPKSEDEGSVIEAKITKRSPKGTNDPIKARNCTVRMHQENKEPGLAGVPADKGGPSSQRLRPIR